jgi:hypothetical protein
LTYSRTPKFPQKQLLYITGKLLFASGSRLFDRVVLGHASGLAPAPRTTANATPAMSHLERLKAAHAEAAQ